MSVEFRSLTPKTKMLVKLWLSFAVIGGALTLWLTVIVLMAVLGFTDNIPAISGKILWPWLPLAALAMIVTRMAVSRALKRESHPPSSP